MLISDDSPLRALPAALNPPQRLIIDGIRLSIEMAELAYGRVAMNAYHTTLAMESGDDEDRPKGVHPALFLDAWSMIDAVHRLRTLIASPSFSPAPEGPVEEDKRICLGGPLREASVIRELRDTIQHLEPRLGGLVRAKQPIFGTLWWVVPLGNEARVVVAAAGAATNVTTPGVVVGQMVATAAPPVDHIHLTTQQDPKRLAHVAGGAHLVVGPHPGTVAVSLTDLRRQLADVVEKLESQVGPQFEGHETSGADLLVAIYVRSADGEPGVESDAGESSDVDS